MASRLLIYVDHHEGALTEASREAIGAGRRLAEDLQVELEAVVLSADAESMALDAARSGVCKVYAVSNPALGDFQAEMYADVIRPYAEGAEAILFPDNGRTRELAAVLAVDLEAGLIPDVIRVDVVDGVIHARRAVYSGKVHSTVRSTGRKPVLLTLRSRAFTAYAGESAPGGVEKIAGTALESSTEVLSYLATQSGVNLTDAAVIVAGGRGIVNNPALEAPAELKDPEAVDNWKAKEGFKRLQELADAMDAALGATRAVVDAGYTEYANQIGQTGKVVTPDLYLAFGISGAIQHMAGIRTARTVVAINKDPEAPIFRSARFGIVGDMHKVIPALVEAFKDSFGS